MALLAVSGCTRPDRRSSVVVTRPTASSPPVAPIQDRHPRSLSAIINNELQLGRYADGEADLQQYLKQHPADRAARAMLHQLTADPQRSLGEGWQPHVVRTGDSYSSLAARYLGDANLFLILARYNNSTNPSMLRVGETLHMPKSGRSAPVAVEAPALVVDTNHRDVAAVTESRTAKARRLQDESVGLLDQGHNDQALARLGEALALDPRLKPVDAKTAALRTQLLGSYHERAIVLYRDQQLEQAIALWNRLLAIDPGYEPAIVYRTRALELQHRLKQY
ncbi:LysM peptidoglycan-binding domain-containing protein [Rhodanobacter umsongensis]|uniref:LysM peptidoglycan-binding domain-containing protein n=2 Tax=Rhodanobacter umsongensis TaxID=633153 RepID=A0ABW0JLJ3_9GAMM